MATITDRTTWTVNNQEARMDKGPLVRVKRGEGHYVKMYEADAIAQGLLPGKPKARPQAENKMAGAPANKSSEPPPDNAAPTGAPVPELDDFTTIPGVGLGTARSLTARGITTYAQLRATRDLSFLTKRGAAAIEAWRAA